MPAKCFERHTFWFFTIESIDIDLNENEQAADDLTQNRKTAESEEDILAVLFDASCYETTHAHKHAGEHDPTYNDQIAAELVFVEH